MASSDEFDTALKELVDSNRLSASKVKGVTELAVKNITAKNDAQIVSSLTRTHKKAGPASKLSSLYIVDAIAREAKSGIKRAKSKDQVMKFEGFLTKVEVVLERIVEESLERGQPDHKEKIRKVVDIWNKSHTFSSDMLRALSVKVEAARKSPISIPNHNDDASHKSPQAEAAGIPANILALLGNKSASGSTPPPQQQQQVQDQPDVQKIIADALASNTRSGQQTSTLQPADPSPKGEPRWEREDRDRTDRPPPHRRERSRERPSRRDDRGRGKRPERRSPRRRQTSRSRSPPPRRDGWEQRRRRSPNPHVHPDREDMVPEKPVNAQPMEMSLAPPEKTPVVPTEPAKPDGINSDIPTVPSSVMPIPSSNSNLAGQSSISQTGQSSSNQVGQFGSNQPWNMTDFYQFDAATPESWEKFARLCRQLWGRVPGNDEIISWAMSTMSGYQTDPMNSGMQNQMPNAGWQMPQMGGQNMGWF